MRFGPELAALCELPVIGLRVCGVAPIREQAVVVIAVHTDRHAELTQVGKALRLPRLPRACANTGNSRAASNAMMPMTTSISISVRPRRFL